MCERYHLCVIFDFLFVFHFEYISPILSIITGIIITV